MRQEVQLVGGRCCRENQHPAEGAMGPQDLRLSSPAERERSAAKDKGTGSQYVAVCLRKGWNSPLIHNPFGTISNKVLEVYFSKELCPFVIIVDFVSACIVVYCCDYATIRKGPSLIFLLMTFNFFLLNDMGYL